MKENKAKYVILGLLSHMPMTGYELKKYSSSWIPYFWEISYGQIYPSLKQMETGGLIDLAEGKIKGKRAESKTYMLTSKGKESLEQWLKDPKQNEVYRSELLLKLFFSSRIPPEVSSEKIRVLKKESLKHRDLLKGEVDKLKEQISLSPDHPYFMFTAMFGEMYYDMCAQWSDKVLRILSRLDRAKRSE